MKNRMNQLLKDKLLLVMMVFGLLTIVAAAGAVRIPDSLDIASSQGMYDAMKNADSGYDGNLRSASGLAAGIGAEVICFL